MFLNCRWRLIEIDTALTDLKGESEHVMSLIHPSNTYMVCILLLKPYMFIPLLSHDITLENMPHILFVHLHSVYMFVDLGFWNGNINLKLSLLPPPFQIIVHFGFVTKFIEKCISTCTVKIVSLNSPWNIFLKVCLFELVDVNILFLKTWSKLEV